MFYALQLKDHKLESLLYKDGVEEDVIIRGIEEFLSYILNFINDTQRIDSFDYAVDIFRKWKSFLISKYKKVYLDDIDLKKKWDVTIDTKDESILHFILNKMDKIDSIKVESIVELIKSIDPFSTLDGSNNIVSVMELQSKIKQDLYLFCLSAREKTRVGLLNDADIELRHAFSLIKKKIEPMDSIELYLYSWALHLLGNLSIYKYKYTDASKWFDYSIRIKNSIPGIPLICVFQTKMKRILLDLFFPKMMTAKSNIIELYEEFSEKRDELNPYNPGLYSSLNTDILNNIAISNLCTNDYGNVIYYASKSIGITQDINKLGMIRSYILLGITEDNYQYALEKISELVSSLNKHEKDHPYIRNLLDKRSIYELSAYREDFSSKLVTVLKASQIEPLDME